MGDLGCFGISPETWLKAIVETRLKLFDVELPRPPLTLRRGLGTCTVPMPVGAEAFDGGSSIGFMDHMVYSEQKQKTRGSMMWIGMDISKETCCLSYFSSGTQSIYLFFVDMGSLHF